MKDCYCPLCHSSDLTQLEIIEFETIKKGYKNLYDINIDVDKSQKKKEISLISCINCDLKFYLPAIAGDESFYEKIQKNDWYYLEQKPEFDIARNYISEKDNVLEIGSGCGHFGNSLRCKSYIGLELSNSAIEMSKKFNLTILNQMIQEHSKNNLEKYDVVCSFQVLEHVSDVNEFIVNSIKCLKENGTLIISVPNDDSFLGYEINGFLNLPPHHLSRWTKKCLTNLEKIFGLTILDIKTDKLNEIHFLANTQSILHQTVLSMFKKNKKLTYKLFLLPQMKIILSTITRFTLFVFPPKQEYLGHSITAIYKKSHFKNIQC